MKDKKHFKKALKRERKERKKAVKKWEKAHREEREAEAGAQILRTVLSHAVARQIIKGEQIDEGPDRPIWIIKGATLDGRCTSCNEPVLRKGH